MTEMRGFPDCFKTFNRFYEKLKVCFEGHIKCAHERTVGVAEKIAPGFKSPVTHVSPFSRTEEAMATAVHCRDGVVNAAVRADEWE